MKWNFEFLPTFNGSINIKGFFIVVDDAKEAVEAVEEDLLKMGNHIYYYD